MALNKIRLGDYIERSTENNHDLKYGIELIEGVTSKGVFDKPKGDPMGVDLKPYKIVHNGAFVYNPTRLNLGSIAYRTEGMCIVSHLYMIFYLTVEGKQIIDPKYLYMYFRRNEFCREVTFRNFGSQRPEFNFNDMSDIEIPLPDISIQRKYVAVYMAMLANQRVYESGLGDLNTAIAASIEEFKHTAPRVAVGRLLEEIDVRNRDGVITNVQGININKEFMPSVANLSTTDLTKYKIIQKNQFAANFMHVMRDEKVPFGLYHVDDPCIISPAYPVFRVKSEDALAEYIMLWLNREESDRYMWFIADSSVRGGLEMNRFYEIEIPLPSKPQQQAVVNFYNARHLIQKNIAILGNTIKDLCPILIKGSLDEAESA